MLTCGVSRVRLTVIKWRCKCRFNFHMTRSRVNHLFVIGFQSYPLKLAHGVVTRRGSFILMCQTIIPDQSCRASSCAKHFVRLVVIAAIDTPHDSCYSRDMMVNGPSKLKGMKPMTKFDVLYYVQQRYAGQWHTRQVFTDRAQAYCHALCIVGQVRVKAEAKPKQEPALAQVLQFHYHRAVQS
jgi:hypothetical protein